jgi:hypothetical protein
MTLGSTFMCALICVNILITLTNLSIMVSIYNKIDVAIEPIVNLKWSVDFLVEEIDDLSERLKLVKTVGDQAVDLANAAAHSKTAKYLKEKFDRFAYKSGEI